VLLILVFNKEDRSETTWFFRTPRDVISALEGHWGTTGPGAETRTRTRLPSRDFKTKRKVRRINVYLIRRPAPFTRVTRSALQSEGYGHSRGHLSRHAHPERRRFQLISAVARVKQVQRLFGRRTESTGRPVCGNRPADRDTSGAAALAACVRRFVALISAVGAEVT